MPDGPDLLARIWVASVGRVPLLLLDTDVEGNPDHYRDVTDRLYGGNSEHRLRQELLLGVGGVRALRAYSRITGAPAPEVFHTNEGHAGFLGLERIRELTVAEGGPKLDFDTALEVGRASTVFTTHTPVPAGIDRFPRDPGRAVLQRRRRHAPASPSTGSSRSAPRTTTAATPRSSTWRSWASGSPSAPTASRMLHGEVSRGMFNGLWPAFDEAEVPIGSITNGVHAPTWVAREVFDLAVEPGRRPATPTTPRRFWAAVDKIPGAERLGGQAPAARAARRRRPPAAGAVVGEARAAQAELGWIDSAFDPDVLTIGFARRVPSYKRLTLMLRDPDRLKRCCSTPSARCSWSSPASRTRPTTAARS